MAKWLHWWDLKTKPLSAIMVRASKQPWYRRKICMSRIYVNNKAGTHHQTTPWINVLPQHCRVLLLVCLHLSHVVHVLVKFLFSTTTLGAALFICTHLLCLVYFFSWSRIGSPVSSLFDLLWHRSISHSQSSCACFLLIPYGALLPSLEHDPWNENSFVSIW